MVSAWVDRAGGHGVRVVIEMVSREAACPACGVLTSRVKGRPLVAHVQHERIDQA